VRYYRGRPVGVPGEDTGEVRAASRDASFFNSPGTARKVHFVAGDGGSACRGMPLVLESVSLPVRDLTMSAAEVPDHIRCRAKGCRERWP